MSATDISGDSAFKLAFGTHTTVTAADTVATGLASVSGCLVSQGSDFAAVASGEAGVSALVSGTDIIIKNWEEDATAGATFGDTVYWMAWGT